MQGFGWSGAHGENLGDFDCYLAGIGVGGL
jgi:hypothetical protein